MNGSPAKPIDATIWMFVAKDANIAEERKRLQCFYYTAIRWNI